MTYAAEDLEFAKNVYLQYKKSSLPCRGAQMIADLRRSYQEKIDILNQRLLDV